MVPSGTQPTTARLAGYVLLTADGAVLPFGDVTSSHPPTGAGASAIAATPDGVYVAARSGGVLAIGAVPHLGDRAGEAGSEIVDIALGPPGTGYWLLDDAGGVFAFDVPFHGSLPGLTGVAHAPAVALAPLADGTGYWILDQAGGIFSFGEAKYYGSIPERGEPLAGPAVDLAAFPAGDGYAVLDAGGALHVFTGSTAQAAGWAPAPIDGGAVALVATQRGALVIDHRGLVHPIGRVPFLGSAATSTATGVVDAAGVFAD